MENYTKTMTAWTPSFGMSTLGHTCARLRAFGAAMVAVQGDVAAIVRIKGDFPGSPAWSPSS
jgi:hypothetical protein